MANDLTAKYIWIIDTLLKYGRLSFEDIDKLWRKSSLSHGDPLPRRTFYHYRRNIENSFNIELKCDATGRYFIEGQNRFNSKSSANLMLESFAVGSALRNNPLPADCVEVEDVPSARDHLSMIIESISNSTKVIFSYSSFSRSRTEPNIVFSPYFIKRYKQRWYVIGLRDRENKIRTYALDRISALILTEDHFERPSTITLEDIFSTIVGVTTSKADVKTVKLRATSTQAKYLRALPLHGSQTEEINDNYSIFTYRLKLNYELVHEILGFGDSIKVLSPPELKAMVVTQLKDTLAQYEKNH